MGSQNPSIKALVKLIDDPDEDIFHHVRDCLLYTSPSPRDYAASRMPSSA